MLEKLSDLKNVLQDHLKNDDRTRITAAVIAALVMGVIALYFWEVAHPIHFKSSSPVIELGETFSPADNISWVFSGDKKDVQTAGSVNGLIPGKYEIDYLYNGKTYTIIATVRDSQAPKLETKNIRVGNHEEVDASSFVESCTDASRYRLVILNPEDLTFENGSKMIQVRAIDEYGNTVTKNAKLTRYDNSKLPISKDTPTSREFRVGDEFVEQTFDFVGADPSEYTITADTSELNMYEPGEYRVYYHFKDSRGNPGIFTEVIVVLPAEEVPVYADDGYEQADIHEEENPDVQAEGEDGTVPEESQMSDPSETEAEE